MVTKISANIQYEKSSISQNCWEAKNGHKAAVLWFTGLSGSGKTTLGRYLERYLFERNIVNKMLDGDNMRHGLCSDLGFDEEGRRENIRRVSESAKLFFSQGQIVICTFISPFLSDRAYARSLFPESQFFEIYVKSDINRLIERDKKGLYNKAINGRIRHFTGISSPYEEPKNPEILIDNTNHTALEEFCIKVVDFLEGKKVLNR